MSRAAEHSGHATDVGTFSHLLAIALVSGVLAAGCVMDQLSRLETRLRARALADAGYLAQTADGLDEATAGLTRRFAGDAQATVRLSVAREHVPAGVWFGQPTGPVSWSEQIVARTGELVVVKVAWSGPFAATGRTTALGILLLVTGLTSGSSITLLLIAKRRTADRLLARLRDAEHRAELSRGMEIMAHDVRKPFSAVKALLEAFASAADPAAAQTMAQVMLPELSLTLRRVDTMLADVLAFGRQAPVMAVATTVDDLVDGALREVASSHPTAAVTLSYRLRHSRKVAADPSQLVRVLANIVGNAVEAMHASGDLWIHARDVVHHRRSAVELTIGNGGSYIPPATLSRLFEPFFTSGKANGTGLGLATAKQVVERHGGSITARSSAEAGTEFVLTLPTVPGCLDRSRGDLPRRLAQVATLVSASGATTTADDFEGRLRAARATAGSRPVDLLVLDDDLAIHAMTRNLVKSLTTGMPLAQVRTAATWAEAHRLVAAAAPDLILCDFALGPGCPDGLTILERLRANGYAGRFFLHSDRTLDAAAQKVLDRLGDGALPKPLLRTKLLGLLTEIVEARPSTASTPKVAVIDDDCFVRELWQLDPDAATAMTFASPEAFLATCRANPALLASLDAVVIDFHFGAESTMNGVDLARELRRMTNTPLILASDLPSATSLDDALVDDLLDDLVDGRIGKDHLAWRHVEAALARRQA